MLLRSWLLCRCNDSISISA